jgi:DNA-binding XRE family transcriptional regulator
MIQKLADVQSVKKSTRKRFEKNRIKDTMKIKNSVCRLKIYNTKLMTKTLRAATVFGISKI